MRPGPIRPRPARAATIDLAPTWAETALVLVAVLQGGTPAGRRMAETELLRMGRLLDELTAQQQPR